jgi:hypothetical protein
LLEELLGSLGSVMVAGVVGTFNFAVHTALEIAGILANLVPF